MKIGIDVDDVIADLHTPWLEDINKAHGTAYTVEDLTQWDFYKDIGRTEAEIYVHLQPELYTNRVKPVEGTLDVINELRRAGHEIVYITSCRDLAMWLAKAAWLEREGYLLPRDMAIPVGEWAEYKSKREVGTAKGIPILVDDSIANCTSWAGVALLVSKPHNKQHIYPGKRLRTFNQLVSEMKFMPAQVMGGTQVHMQNPPEPTVQEAGWVHPVLPMTPPATSKPTNPKDAVATDKMPLHFVSGVVKAYAAIAHYLGNVKYGAWNYRAGGARASVYLGALQRHMDRWQEGEECDSVDGTPHLANALACINILIEAHENGNLVDDRPPSKAVVLNRVYAKLEALMPRIREQYKDRPQPKHFTIGDTV